LKKVLALALLLATVVASIPAAPTFAANDSGGSGKKPDAPTSSKPSAPPTPTPSKPPPSPQGGGRRGWHS